MDLIVIRKDILNFFQKLSKAFLMPIALLSVASIFLGIASIFLWHEGLKELFPIINAPGIQYVASLLNTMSSAVMDNLGFLFALSLAIALCDDHKEYAGLGAVLAYMSFNMSMAVLVAKVPFVGTMFPTAAFSSILGVGHTLNTGVLGGIIIGGLSGKLSSRAGHVKLPIAISFFGGVRFIPIANIFVFVLVGQLFPFIWLPLSKGIYALANAVTSAGEFGPFLYAFFERLLIPTGLHHIWNTVIRDTAVSGIFHFDATHIYEGGRIAYNKFLEIGHAPQEGVESMVRFLRAGQIPMTMFMLPAFALAMYHTANEDKKSKIKPLLLAGVFTSMIAGVTEPLEFAFLFASPVWYFIYAIANGLSFMIMSMFGNTMGGTEASIIGLLLFGFLQEGSTWWYPVLVGIPCAIFGYLGFKKWIIMKDLKTPGREDEEEIELDLAEMGIDESITDPRIIKALTIIYGLGGVKNIVSVDCCFSRLRVQLKDCSLVSKPILNTTGPSGFVQPDESNIQVIYGPTVNIIKESVQKQLAILA